MSDSCKDDLELPPEQQAIRDNCFQPSGTCVEFPKEEVEQSIPDRFEKIVGQYPNQIAISVETQGVTYSELNAMANCVAHAIIAERGSDPEPVGLLLEKGVEQIAAMLGILKAGKFFVLLDPSFPAARITSVIEDSQAALLVVDQRTVLSAPQVTTRRCQLIRFDRLAQPMPAEDPRIPISPYALACIVYTSGSTGEPKGVVRNHRTLLHGAMLRVRTDGISKDDRLAHITAGTSNAVTNSFYALLQGATLVAMDIKREGVARLASRLIEEKISICLIASPVFRKLCTTLTGNESFPALRYLRLRSDTVYKSDVELHRKHFPPTCSLANGLSSSETGPLREYRIYHDTEFGGAEVPVGYALEDKEILLLNDDGEEVGFNEVGEILVRSEYLSLGYWHNSELTARKFKTCPLDPRKRLYYTGDLGLMLSDGCLIHKGRKDFRVKIRGYGVDLIEVERVLRRHSGVKEAIVVASKSKSDETRLIAYFISSTQLVPTVNDLRGFLQKSLADYMIPSVFVSIDKIPLTSNGKVDRKALPVPDNSRPALDTPFVEPRTVIERELVSIWAKILALQDLGIHDNFFDLGGHSLAATRVVSQVIKSYQLELPLQSLFQSPTVAEMAAVITEHLGKTLGGEELDRILTELESMSDEAAQQLAVKDRVKG
jgi:amino acid adenylation domain-containing protein